MASWAEFEAAAPEIATKGRSLLYQYGPPLGFIATIRPDGGPRLHPFCPIVHDGRLWAFLLAQSPKCRDLQRDARYALHAMPGEEVDDEFMVRGHGRRRDVDGDLHRAIVDAAKPATVGADTELLFDLDVDRAMTATYTHRGQWPPVYAIWRAHES